jgi:hypothetical protein
MKTLACTAPSQTKWMALWSVCGMAIALSSSTAHAQFGARPLGAVLGVPIQALGPVIAANALQNNVNVLHVSQAAFGNFNTQVATISVAQRNQGGGGGLLSMKLPKAFLPSIQQFNNNAIQVDQVAVGNFNTQIADVKVAQSNQTFTPGASKFLLCPTPLVPSVLQLNDNVAIVNQLAVGDGNTQVALLNIDQSNSAGFKYPLTGLGSLSQFNSNFTQVGQTAVGNGNTQVATINVSQSNN